MVRNEKIVRCMKLHAKLRFLGFLYIFGTFLYKAVQTWFVWHETCYTTLLVYFIVLKWFESKLIVICLKLRAKLCF